MEVHLDKKSYPSRAAYNKLLEVFLLSLIGGIFFWWLFAAIILPIADEGYNTQTLSLAAEESLIVRYPRIIHAEQTIASLEITLRHNPGATNITVTLPPGLLWVGGDSYSPSRLVAFSGKSSIETKIIAIKNPQTATWWSEKKPIAFKSANAAQNDINIINVKVEGNGRSILRRFGRLGEDASSLFPLGTLLASIAGWVYQWRQKQLEDEKQQNEDRRKNAGEKLSVFWTALVKSNLPEAKEKFEEIRTGGLAEWLEEYEIKDAQALLAIANGDNLENALALVSRRPNETTGALLCSADRQISDPLAMYRVLRAYPLQDINSSILEKFQEMRNQWLSNKPSQPNVWPILPKGDSLPPIQWGDTDSKHPFPGEHAEDEIQFLFSKKPGLFWAEHPMYLDLERCRGFNIITGPVGVGKTAFALSLGQYSSKPNCLNFYHKGWFRFDQVQLGLAKRLLHFIENHPTHLILLGEDEKALLANWLASQLDKSGLLAHINYVLQHIEEAVWLKNVRDQTKKKLWQTEATVQLQLFKQTIERSRKHTYPPPLLLSLFKQIAGYFGFQRIQLVLDFPQLAEKDNFLKNDKLTDWLFAEYDLFIFTPEAFEYVSHLQKLAGTLVKVHKLCWKDEQLLEMARERWKCANNPGAFDDKFTDASLGKFIEYSQNSPQSLAQLYRRIIELKGDAPKITVQLVETAEKALDAKIF